MKKYLATAIVLTVFAIPALAADGRVSNSALADLGLGGMQVVSDTEGMQVRGMSSNAYAYGGSLVFGQLIDNVSASFFVASDLNGGSASAENAGLNANSTANQGPQGSSVAGQLMIVGGFSGTFLGNAGNASNIGAAGLSAATGF